MAAIPVEGRCSTVSLCSTSGFRVRQILSTTNTASTVTGSAGLNIPVTDGTPLPSTSLGSHVTRMHRPALQVISANETLVSLPG